MGETYALLPAAGRGERFRGGSSRESLTGDSLAPSEPESLPHKLLIPLGGKPVLAHTLLAFERCAEVDGIVLVGSPADHAAYRQVAAAAGLKKPLLLAEGGASRQESVARGLAALPDSVEIVAVHDAARPLVSPEVISRTIHAAREHGAGLAGIPMVDTVKRIDAEGRIIETLPRSELFAAQTPQTFRVSLLREAHARAAEAGIDATDDAALVERLGHPVLVVPGDRRNLKLTTPEDLIVAEALLSVEHRALGVGGERDAQHPSPNTQRPTPNARIGFGYDIHRLAEGRKLVLGGVEIPHSVGLEGHSDADVLLHALMDALLGAAGLPDIGHLFPNTDERWRGASSRAMLREVARRLNEAGWRPSNVDLTLIAERPKIAPHLAAMRTGIAGDLGLPESCVGIKATTNERVGAVGREEAMAAQAVAMLVPDERTEPVKPPRPSSAEKRKDTPSVELPLDPF
ncbi:MAG: 2-C-methyl-D-erythritol 4-phosphate cytidylyltransferase [Armatimonadetes bacterium]|nr:2-C-methyl-D-erythritol 4-phosphate cytidylyltransferase [Armatimonadota bacterium]